MHTRMCLMLIIAMSIDRVHDKRKDHRYACGNDR